MTTIAIIVAAGRGSRVGDAADGPKQYADLGGSAMLTRTLATFAGHNEVDRLLAVIHPDDTARYRDAARTIGAKLLVPVPGGATRQQSVHLGLEALARLAPTPERVLIHDAARPFITPALIDRVLAALSSSPAALPGLLVADTLKRIDDRGVVTGTVDRAGLWRAQTPQGFTTTRFSPRIGRQTRRAQRFHRRSRRLRMARRRLRPCRGRGAQHQDHHRGGSRLGATAHGEVRDRDHRHPPRHRLRRPQFSDGVDVWLCGIRCRTPTRSKAIPMPMSDCMPSPTRCSAPSATAISASISRRAIRNGKARAPKCSSPMRRAGRRRRLRDRQCRRDLICEAPRVGPHRDAMRAEIARSSASRSAASASRRRRRKASVSPAAARASRRWRARR